MFRLSQKADYGLILLSSLVPYAKASEAKRPSFVSISEIAKKHKISPKFLSQIAQELKKAGILRSKEGIAGGYALAKGPSEIKLLDVLKILEGEIMEGRCFEEGHKCVCGAKDIWRQIKKQISATIGQKSIADLIK